MNSDRFVLFGGIPRSGTTLTCHILNQFPGSVALVESMNMRNFLQSSTEAERANFIKSYLTDVYTKIQNDHPIELNVIDNQQTNTFAESNNNPNIKRQNKIKTKELVHIDRQLDHDFKLILKHPNAFMALLPELRKSFKIFVQIRNPISVLASWNSIEHPLNRGHAPMAEAFDKKLKNQLSSIEGDLDRQIALLDWYYSTAFNLLPPNKIIKYEDVISTNGDVLSQIVPQNYSRDEVLVNRNRNSLYDHDYMDNALQKLLALREHACWKFYSEDEMNF